MLASGLSPWQTEGTAELFDWIRNGGTDSVTPSVRGADRCRNPALSRTG